MVWKTVTPSFAGTSELFGGDDLNKISNYFGGVLDVDTADINSNTQFRSGKLRLRNPANTFSYITNASAITGNINITEPLLGAPDVRLYEANTAAITNKILTANLNTITDTGSAVGDILKHNGTRFVKLARGSANNLLKVNAAGTDLEWGTSAAGTMPMRFLLVRSDGSGDYTGPKAAIDYVNTQSVSIPFTIILSAEDYSTDVEINLTRGNVAIRGAGQGLTRIIGSTSLPENTQIFQVAPTNASAGYPLTVDAIGGTLTITVSAADSLNFTVGQYLLIKTVRNIDTDNPTRYAAEIHQIAAIDAGTGVITLDSSLYENYNTTTDSTDIAPLPNFYLNISISGITFTSARTSMTTQGAGMVFFRYCRNLNIVDCEFKQLYHAGLMIWQVIDCKVLGCSFYDMRAPGVASVGYGVSLRGACVGTLVEGCNFDKDRHGVTQGAGGGTNLEGKTRNFHVIGNFFRGTNTSHIDCHQGAADVGFIGNTMIGDDTSANAIQCRSPAVVANNVIEGINGRGISCFKGGSDVQIVGNYIFGCISGVFIDVDCHREQINGNYITDASTDAIVLAYTALSGSHGGDDTMITNNFILNCPGDGVDIDSSAAVMVNANYIRNNSGVSINIKNTQGTCANIQVANNYILNNGTNTPALAGTGHVIRGNYGVVTENTGSAVFSGTGSQVSFVIPHGMIAAPKNVEVGPASADARGSISWTVDATNITVLYGIAPPSGSSNVTLWWSGNVY